MKTVDAILKTDRNIIVESDAKTNSSTRLLDNLQSIAIKQTPKEKGKLETFETKEISLALIEPVNLNPLTLYSSIVANMSTISLKPNGKEVIETAVTLPSELVGLANGTKIYSYVFKSDVLFLDQDDIANQNMNDTQKKNESIVQSSIVSLDVTNKTITNLTQPVQLVFRVKKIEVGVNRTGVSKCKFWDPTFHSKLIAFQDLRESTRQHICKV